jgi:hypothetical protein
MGPSITEWSRFWTPPTRSSAVFETFFRRAGLVTVGSAALTILWSLPAMAHSHGNPHDRESGASGVVSQGGVIIGAVDTQPDDEPEPISGSESGGSACQFSPVGPNFERERALAADLAVPREAQFYLRDCDEGTLLQWYVPGVTDPAGDLVVGPLIEEAFERLEPPVPGLVTAPPLGSEVLTGLPMYLAVDEGAFGVLSGSVSAGQFTVAATVVPVSSSFVPGDGSEARVCEGRGSVWSAGERPSEGDCTHTFTHTPVHLNGEGEVFEVSARVVYEAWYTVEGPVLAGEFELGRFEGPQVVVEVPVIERRAVRTTAGS